MTTQSVRVLLVQRLVWNCCGCGFEPASVAVGADPASPDETYGDHCWRTNTLARTLPHTHVDGRDCGCEENQ